MSKSKKNSNLQDGLDIILKIRLSDVAKQGYLAGVRPVAGYGAGARLGSN